MADVPRVPKRPDDSHEHERPQLAHPPAAAIIAARALQWARTSAASLEPAAGEVGEELLGVGSRFLGPLGVIGSVVLTPENAGEPVYDENQRIAQRLGDLPYDESRVYPNVALQPAGSQAMADFKRCFPDFKSFSGNSLQAFRDLKSSVPQAPPGWHMHHLVEQSRTGQFGTQAIQNTANLIALPDGLHRKINGEYGRRLQPLTEAYEFAESHPELNIRTIRDYVKALPYQQQRQYNVDTIRRLMKDRSLDLSDADRRLIETQLDALARPLCELQMPQDPPHKPRAKTISDGRGR